MELMSSKPIYIQIKDLYENLIDNDTLKEGDEMPSVREIAVAYGINPNTVQRALTLMVDDGYLTNIPKKGFYVNKVKKDRNKIIENALNALYEQGISKEEILNAIKGVKK